jgi:hypothetical protein
MVNKIDEGMIMNPYNLMWESNVKHWDACISASVVLSGADEGLRAFSTFLAGVLA